MSPLPRVPHSQPHFSSNKLASSSSPVSPLPTAHSTFDSASDQLTVAPSPIPTYTTHSGYGPPTGSMLSFERSPPASPSLQSSSLYTRPREPRVSKKRSPKEVRDPQKKYKSISHRHNQHHRSDSNAYTGTSAPFKMILSPLSGSDDEPHRNRDRNGNQNRNRYLTKHKFDQDSGDDEEEDDNDEQESTSRYNGDVLLLQSSTEKRGGNAVSCIDLTDNDQRVEGKERAHDLRIVRRHPHNRSESNVFPSLNRLYTERHQHGDADDVSDDDSNDVSGNLDERDRHFSSENEEEEKKADFIMDHQYKHNLLHHIYPHRGHTDHRHCEAEEENEEEDHEQVSKEGDERYETIANHDEEEDGESSNDDEIESNGNNDDRNESDSAGLDAEILSLQDQRGTSMFGDFTFDKVIRNYAGCLQACVCVPCCLYVLVHACVCIYVYARDVCVG